MHTARVLTQVAEELHSQRRKDKEEEHEEETQIPHLQRDNRKQGGLARGEKVSRKNKPLRTEEHMTKTGVDSCVDIKTEDMKKISKSPLRCRLLRPTPHSDCPIIARQRKHGFVLSL